MDLPWICDLFRQVTAHIIMPGFSSHPFPTQIPYNLLFVLFGTLCRDVDLGVSVCTDTDTIVLPS
jgi:hypothetical protein